MSFWDVLNSRQQLCFVHFPKTGGSTFVDGMRRRLGTNAILGYTTRDLEARSAVDPSALPQLRPLLIAGHQALSEVDSLVPQGAAVLSVAREPAARLQSFYLFARSGRQNNKVIAAAQAHDFLGFLEFLRDHRPRILNNQQTRLAATSAALRDTPDLSFGSVREEIEARPYAIVPIQDCDDLFPRVALALSGEAANFKRRKVGTAPPDKTLTQACAELIAEHNAADAALYQWAVDNSPGLLRSETDPDT